MDHNYHTFLMSSHQITTYCVDNVHECVALKHRVYIVKIDVPQLHNLSIYIYIYKCNEYLFGLLDSCKATPQTDIS